MNVIQIFILIFIVYVAYGLLLRLKKKELSPQLFVIWLFFWLVVVSMVVWPGMLNYIADKVGVGRGVDVAVYVSVLVLFYAVFRMFVRLEKIEKNISEIVRRISITNYQKGKDQNESRNNFN